MLQVGVAHSCGARQCHLAQPSRAVGGVGCQMWGGFSGTGSRSHGLDAAQQAELITLPMNCVFWLFFFQKILPEWSESRQWCEPNHVKERGRRLAPDKSRTWCLMVTQIPIGKFVINLYFFVCLLASFCFPLHFPWTVLFLFPSCLFLVCSQMSVISLVQPFLLC